MSNQSEGNLDALVATFISGYLGYVAGLRRFAGWEPIIKNYNDRINHLAYFKITRPVTFINTFVTNLNIYMEAILSFLFGLPNASVPMTLRCLEIGLKNKYIQDIGQSPPDKLYDLIEWAEKYLGNRKDIAHGFRILRNLVHSPTIMSEQSALESISHVSIILNLLYVPPLQIPSISTCQNCKVGFQVNIPIIQYYLGNIFTANCFSCHQTTSILII
jgi:hypothetical protein